MKHVKYMNFKILSTTLSMSVGYTQNWYFFNIRGLLVRNKNYTKGVWCWFPSISISHITTDAIISHQPAWGVSCSKFSVKTNCSFIRKVKFMNLAGIFLIKSKFMENIRIRKCFLQKITIILRLPQVVEKISNLYIWQV